MNIPEDYTRITEKGDHLLREKLRIDTLLVRMSEVCKRIKTLVSEKEKLIETYKELISLKTILPYGYKVTESDLSLCKKYINIYPKAVEDKCKLIRLNLKSMPKYHQVASLYIYHCSTVVDF